MAKKLNEEEKQKERTRRNLHNKIESIFYDSGFSPLPTMGIEVNISGQKGDFDSVFFYENIIVFSEDTIDKSVDHLKKTVLFFRQCFNHKDEVLSFLKENFIKFKNGSCSQYSDSDFEFVFTYTSKKTIDSNHKILYGKDMVFIDEKYLCYFSSISKTIKKSTRFELFKFLGINLEKVGGQNSSSVGNGYTALILPETPSGFPKEYKLVSFLIDPATLLKQSYVLRKDGWRDNDRVYQRILIKNKITNMRKYLAQEKRVFINNVIVTLPDDVVFYEKDGKTVLKDFSANKVKESIILRIPFESSNIGIIDGQHRVFSYHEGDDIYENLIGKLRDKQHLLVTGIVYPKNLPSEERMKLEAKLFLEINDKQTRTNAALRQVIGTIVDPFSDISVAKKVLNNLASIEPMKDILEQHYFDKGKLKTTSIVSYGMRHIVKFSGNDSFFTLWNNKKKNSLNKAKNLKLLDVYTKYCTDQTKVYLSAFKNNIPKKMWTTNQKVSRVLTVTTITGLIHCMQILIRNNKIGDFKYYNKNFKKLNKKIIFTPKGFMYKSSHWNDLGEEIYNICFR